jgi:hypothetical protein
MKRSCSSSSLTCGCIHGPKIMCLIRRAEASSTFKRPFPPIRIRCGLQGESARRLRPAFEFRGCESNHWTGAHFGSHEQLRQSLRDSSCSRSRNNAHDEFGGGGGRHALWRGRRRVVEAGVQKKQECHNTQGRKEQRKLLVGNCLRARTATNCMQPLLVCR